MVSLSKKTSGDSPTTTYTFEKAQFEAHGASTDYTDPAEVRWIDDTHAVLNIGLNNHGIFNPVKIDNPHYDDRIAGVVGIGNFFGDDEKRVQWWKPWESSDFRLLGLKDGQPIGDQAWAAFRGRLGDSYPTKLKGAVYFDGRNLSQPDWWYVSIVAAGASALNKLPSNVTFADGPDGPAGRKWVKQQGVQGAV